MTNLARPPKRLLRHRLPARGFSMVELMVAITLSLILLAGAAQVFLGNRAANRFQENMNFLQENGRIALHFLTSSARMADHWGGVDSGDVKVRADAIAGIGSCDLTWITTVGEPLRGYDGGPAQPLPANCLDAADYVPDTDVLVTRYAGVDKIDASAALEDDRIYVRSAVAGFADLFRGQQGVLAELPDADGTYNYPYVLSAYFIRPCAEKNLGQPTCTADADDGTPLPTLTRLTLYGNTLVQEPLVSGVEQMQIEYGIAAGTGDRVERWMTAGEVTNWDDVVSTRIGVVVRTTQGDPSYTDPNTYALPGGYTHTPASTGIHFGRRLFSTLVQVRNRSRS